MNTEDPHVLLGRIIDAVTDLAHLVLRSQRELAALKRGEFICRRCGLRKDSEPEGEQTW